MSQGKRGGVRTGLSLIAIAIAIAIGALLVTPRLEAQDTPPIDEERAIRALAAQLTQQLGALGLTDAEFELLVSSMTEARAGKGLDPRNERANMTAFQRKRLTAAREAEQRASAEFAKAKAAEAGAQTFASGLVYRELKSVDGPKPTATSTVKVHYHGTLRDGTVFDSSVDRGQPATFPLQGVIKCWTEGVQKMSVGTKARLTCPSDIAYGTRGSPPLIGPGATLSFDVELLEIVKQ